MLLSLLNDDRQIHPWMDETVDVKGPCSCKWPDLDTRAIDHDVIDDWRPGFSGIDGVAILPGTIGQNVDYRDIIYQEQLCAFADRDDRLAEVGRAHMDRWDAVGVARRRGRCCCRWRGQRRNKDGAEHHPGYSRQRSGQPTLHLLDLR